MRSDVEASLEKYSQLVTSSCANMTLQHSAMAKKEMRAAGLQFQFTLPKLALKRVTHAGKTVYIQSASAFLRENYVADTRTLDSFQNSSFMFEFDTDIKQRSRMHTP